MRRPSLQEAKFFGSFFQKRTYFLVIDPSSGEAMNAARLGLYGALVLLNVAFLATWLSVRKRHASDPGPTLPDIITGVVTAFFDTLGIGSYATTTAAFTFLGRPSGELIPGTLNVGHNGAAFLETAIFLTAVAVDPSLLAAMITASAVGAFLSAGVVSRMPRRAIQTVMGIALLIGGCIFAATNLGLLPPGGTALALHGWRFGVAVGGNFVFGALMSAGIGLYAPCMIMLFLLGLHPLAAFPIMMGSCGLLQPLAGIRFLRTGRFAWGASLGLTYGDVFGVLIAAFVVKSLPLTGLRWLVVCAVLYASLSMLRAVRNRPASFSKVAAAETP
jgi:uncharacterized membrane protein YfcA